MAEIHTTWPGRPTMARSYSYTIVLVRVGTTAGLQILGHDHAPIFPVSSLGSEYRFRCSSKFWVRHSRATYPRIHSEKVSKKTKNCTFATFEMSFLCSIKALYMSNLTFLINSDSFLQGLQAGMRGLSWMSIFIGALSFKVFHNFSYLKLWILYIWFDR